MRKLLRKLLLRPVMWANRKFASKPERKRIGDALDKLYHEILEQKTNRGIVIPFEQHSGKFIIFSDQHKGARNGADDFTLAEPNYLAALEHYLSNDFCFVCLGDSEELWENTLTQVKKHNTRVFETERKFAEQHNLVKIVGNHDLFWGNDPFAWWQLRNIFGVDLKVYDAVVLATAIGSYPLRIFCTHGHQGDANSDGNWFSKWFVARVWGPLQAYLHINPNTPAYNTEKKTLHNEIMYEWSARQSNTLLLTGHTHQPVFESLTHIERLYRRLQAAQSGNDSQTISEIEGSIRKIEKQFTAIAIDYLTMRPTYFNSGCCCFADGDITGIEIDEGCMRLVKWSLTDQFPAREILEEISLKKLSEAL
jgi:UDP-2,3-diacylglucosamine pyrophosphatase LpxH